ncbi:MAG: hypothetical protein KC646_00580 [Candidatus Cloacimonetes bacterium]|nr:hypothetical protein [Candidatus Cloacimonadota bacterium]
MKTYILLYLLLASSVFSLDLTKFKSGDLIFQTLSTSFGDGVQDTTKSDWAHVGILKWQDNDLFVVEATVPRVKITPIAKFLKNCKNKIAVTRLTYLDKDQINKMIQRAETHLGKYYDTYFVLNDVNKLYCSELVYDALNHVLPNTFKSSPMDFSGALDYWKKYFKNRPIPQGEPGVSPEDSYILKDSLLIYHYKKTTQQIYKFEKLYAK